MIEIKETDLCEKFENLKKFLERLGSVAIAFSGGVDSTFLLSVACQVLGSNVAAITGTSLSFPKRELDETVAFTKLHNIRHITVQSDEMSIEGFSKNPPNRCYLCKFELFTKIKAAAIQCGITCVAEGSNTDDAGDYRPGLQALSELGILSPLRQVGLSKKEIRGLSEKMGLATWDKQSFACLVTRLPYGEDITPDKLRMIDQAEQALVDMGFRQIRVRYHGNLARIETDQSGFDMMSDINLRKDIYNKFRAIGFDYTSIDILGYRTGSMNETLKIC